MLLGPGRDLSCQVRGQGLDEELGAERDEARAQLARRLFGRDRGLPEGEQVARMWFVGSNPLLDHDSPVDAIRAGRYTEVVAAAEAMAEGGFLG